jgi:hypothetical protein
MKAIHVHWLISLALLLPDPVCAQTFAVISQLESGQ